MNVAELLSAARGQTPADLVLKNGRIVNVFSGEIEAGDIAIYQDRIAGIGTGYTGKEVIDLGGAFVAPGLIDAHVHIESSLCTPANFASAIVPRGVTSVVTDPHEVANVAGIDGVRYMHATSRGLALSVFLMAPSCVPATHMADAGATLDASALQKLIDEKLVHGLAEVMNFPGVINGDKDMLAKIAAYQSTPIDGHAPGVIGKALNAYIASGIGSDHECVNATEAKEKLSRGLYILIREATNARNLDALLPLITPQNARRICFCTDDRVPRDLLDVGSVDYMLRRAIEFGVDPFDAFRCCTLNTAEWFGLHDRGAIAPGRRADLFVFDDLRKPEARAVYANGKPVAQDGKMIATSVDTAPPLDFDELSRVAVRGKCEVDASQIDLRIKATSNRIRVIASREGQLITDSMEEHAVIENGFAIASPARDILKMAVIERHHRTGTMGLGFIKGFGLKTGAIAGTVAHDHHNLVVIGSDDESMLVAIRHLSEIGGGMCVVGDNKQIKASLALPIAGLMSDQPIHIVRDAYDQLLAQAKHLGSTMHDPFMAMSFMALEVIPSLKLTNQGLVDVETFRLTNLFV